MPPLIYEVPAAISGSVDQVWLGASSSVPATGAADPNWGGCNVWGSLDNATYVQIATIGGSTPQGFLTAAFADGSGWDTTHTLSVDLTISGGTLSTTTEAAAQNGATLCLVDNELLAFEIATLTAPNKYDLTNIQRGLFGTAHASHVEGAAFSYVAGTAVLTQAIPPQWAGVATIFLKFQSFNIFRSGGQDLSTCTAYVFVPGGTADGPIMSAGPGELRELGALGERAERRGSVAIRDTA